MKEIEAFISNHIRNQFPAHQIEDGPLFVAFLEAYYEFLESDPKYTSYTARRIFEYADIDETTEAFMEHFREKYLESIPSNLKVNTPFMVKHVMDVYRSKGTPRAVKLLIRLIYGADSEVYLPSKDILKPSDSKWIIPKYIEVEEDFEPSDFIGKCVTGSISGASAVVSGYIRKRVENNYINVVFITNIKGEFVTDEIITSDDSTIGDPKIKGSLSSIEISPVGSGYSKGDRLDVVKGGVTNGVAKVSTIANTETSISFTIVDGGWGFASDGSANLIISDTHLFVSNSSFTPLSTITQSLVSADVASSNGISVGDEVTDGGAEGLILRVTSNTEILIQVANGDFTSSANVSISGTDYDVSNVTDVSATGLFVGKNDNIIGLKSTSNNEFIFESGYSQISSNGTTEEFTRIGEGAGATYQIKSVTDTEIVNINNDLIGGNNYFGDTFMSLLCQDGIPLGFSGAPSFTLTDNIGDMLGFTTKTIGEISSLKNVNIGSDYDTDVFSYISQPEIAIRNKRWLEVWIDNVSGTFNVGERVTTPDSGRGIVVSFDDTKGLLILERRSVQNEINEGERITGSNSGARGDVVYVDAVLNPLNIAGLNADISGDVTRLTGTPVGVTVINSGYGHVEGDEVTLMSGDTVAATGIVGINAVGTGSGYWSDTNSHLNSDKKIRDNDYLQEFSYEIISRISINKYRNILNNLTHMAGTKMFGKVLINDTLSTTPTISTAIEIS